jgi:hypothetical protein
MAIDPKTTITEDILLDSISKYTFIDFDMFIVLYSLTLPSNYGPISTRDTDSLTLYKSKCKLL